MAKKKTALTWKSRCKRAIEGWKPNKPKWASFQKVVLQCMADQEDALLTAACLRNCPIVLRGISGIAENRLAEGWADLHTDWRYNAWRLHLEVEASQFKWGDIIEDATLMLPASIALRETEYATWLADAILKHFRDEGVRLNAYRSFVILLAAHFRKKAASLAGWKPKLGAYAGVNERWDQPDALASPLQAICDYHWATSSFLGEGPFWKFPYVVFPAEVIALSVIRKETQAHHADH